MGRFASRLTNKVLRDGYAGCPPDAYYQTKCEGKYRYRRRCYTPPSCGSTVCGPWSYVDANC